MPLNKVNIKTNMYSFLNDYPTPGADRGYTINFIKGTCPNECPYCYMLGIVSGAPRLDRREFRVNLGSGNFIFVGSSIDMWHEDIPIDWKVEVLDYCSTFDNKYLYQSKYPYSLVALERHMPGSVVLATTIETNRWYPEYMGKTILPLDRALCMRDLNKRGREVTITIEPIMDFDMEEMVQMIEICGPSWVSIGADSKRHNLPEPERDKVLELESKLSKFTKVYFKDNLDRIIQK